MISEIDLADHNVSMCWRTLQYVKTLFYDNPTVENNDVFVKALNDYHFANAALDEAIDKSYT